MTLKESTFLVAVLLCTCSAVKVTIGDLGDIIEGSETRMMCNIVRDNPASTADPIITWNNVTGGSADKIATFLSGTPPLLELAYADKFTVDANDGSIVIANTLRSYSGTYQCSVTVLDDGSGEDDVLLDVIYLETPVLTFTTPVIEGNRVELMCTTVANPTPVITFKKDGAIFQSGGQSTFTYSSVARTDAGNYECEVMNGAGTKSTASQMIEVYYTPEIAFGNIEASPSETIVVSFDVDSNPPAVYEWTTNPPTADTDRNPETYTFVVSDKIGTIYTVTLSTSNVAGSTRSSVKVTVVAWTTTRPTLMSVTTNTFTTQLSPDDDKDTGLIIGIFFIGLVGALGVIIAHVAYVQIKQIPNRKSTDTQKVEKRKQETYMEYVSDPCGPTYQDNTV